ncbi:hypothetical protein BGZ98_001853 [Dissophora globulifera]|nr:hypothetical protein BGZ98_001853 [Dissophora globulifera]
MDSSTHDQTSGESSNQDDKPAQVAQAPVQENQDEPSLGDDEASAWETESSAWETESSDDSVEIEDSVEGEDDDDDDDDDDMDDDMDDMQMFLANPVNFPHIEALTASLRANRRPEDDDDTWSDFSGDEKYEPRENLNVELGGGDRDMIDSGSENMFSDISNMDLSYKIRQLMIKLTKGRKERERKLGIGAWQDAAATSRSPLSPTSPTSSSSQLSTHGAYLHRLIVRGADHPQEVKNSPAVSFHQQCANSLTVTPSSMGLLDDVFTLHFEGVMRCGMPQSRKENGMDLDPGDSIRMAYDTVFKPYTEKLQMLKATKFIKSSLFRPDQPPPVEPYVPIYDGQNPLCIAHKYGYLAMGAESGDLIVYCTDCMHGEEEPTEIHNDPLQATSMLNSVQIVRWPRYHRDGNMADNGGVDTEEAQDFMEEEENETNEEGYDEQEGYPKKSGQFDHYLVMTGNEDGLFIAALPDHPNHDDDDEDNSFGGFDSNTYDHEFKFKEDHTWIRHGFSGVPLNDARVSPNGRWIAVVGDDTRVWTVEVSHVPETEEQRIAREEREQEIMLESLETYSDSEYSTDDSIPDLEDEPDVMGDKDGPRGEKRPRESDEGAFSDPEEATSFKNQKGARAPRLLHQFGHPVEMPIPAKLVFPTPPTRGRRRAWQSNASRYSSQYVAWNSTSTKFAHSSDVSSRVFVWSMPSREIVCCVDVGGPSYAIEFHPKLENVFAVANWYGFVHVVDVTGCCIGDKDLVPSNAHYNGEAQEGPSVAGCEGPHYEEKHDILMLSFRGEWDKSLRILDCIRGLGWSTDGRHLYVATLRRVLQFELMDGQMRIPSLFQLCARKVREWSERLHDTQYTYESRSKINKDYAPMPEEWRLVPPFIKRKIWGDMFLMRSHDGDELR